MFFVLFIFCLVNFNESFSIITIQEYDIDPLVIFGPVVEPDLPGAFITKHPHDGQDENSLKIPFLTGTNYDEGLLKSAGKGRYILKLQFYSYV